MVVEQGDALSGLQAQNFIRLHQGPLGVAAGLGVGTGAAVDWGKQGCEGHLIIGDGDGDHAALFGDVLGGAQVVTAHIEGLVKGVELILPVLARILLRPLAEALDHHLAAHVEAADTVEHIGDALHVADVAVFVQAEVDQHLQAPVLAVEPGVVGEAGEGQGEKEGAQEAVGAVLGGYNDKVGTGLLARQQQIHVVVAGNLVHQSVLEDGQPVAQADGNVAPEVFTGLEEQAVVALGGVLRRQGRQDLVDLLNALFRQQAVHIPKPPLLDGEQVPGVILQVADIVDERHEQV